MLRVHCDDLWSVVAKLARRSSPRLAAVAFVSSDRKVACGRGDTLVTDASDANIADGLTTAAVLRAAVKRGARVHSLAGLHAKVVCLGRFSVIGSANMSSSSVTNLIEAAVVTDHPGVLSDARALVSRLQAAAKEVDERFLKRIEQIHVTRRRGPTSRPRLPRAPKQPESWVVGVHELPEGRFPDEAAPAQRGEAKARKKLGNPRATTSWLRFTGNSNFRRTAQPGDSVIQLWRSSASSRSVRVYFPTPIVFRHAEPTCTRFYVAEFGDDERRSITFGDFQRIWKAAGGEGKPTANAVRRLSPELAERLVALWPVRRRRTSPIGT